MAELQSVQGVEEFTAVCDKIIYGEADKVVKQSMTDAAKKAVKVLKREMPRTLFAKLAKYKFKQGSQLKFMNVGLFENFKTLDQFGYPKTKGNNKTVYMIAYWHNYGTLNRRDPSHIFRERIKPKSRNSHRGVRPQRFFEKAQPAVDKEYQSAFDQAFKERTEKFFKDHAK